MKKWEQKFPVGPNIPTQPLHRKHNYFYGQPYSKYIIRSYLNSIRSYCVNAGCHIFFVQGRPVFLICMIQSGQAAYPRMDFGLQ